MLSETAICSNDTRADFTQDSFDVAAVPLTNEQASQLQDSTVLRMDDVSFRPVDKNNFVSIFGFPHLWSTRSTDQQPIMTSKAFQFTTDLYSGPTSDLSNYSDRFHLLLNASNEHLYDEKGSPARFQTLGGQPASFPSDIRGISGCSVWTIGDSKKPPIEWDSDQARLIAVQTGVYRQRQVIKSTRWIAVSTLLYEAFPELRGAMSLFRSD